MTGDIDEPGNDDQVEDSSTEETRDEDIVLSTDDDVVGGSTAEIKVDELVAKIDSTDAEESARQREVKEKLEALDEQRDDELGSTYNFDINKDL